MWKDHLKEIENAYCLAPYLFIVLGRVEIAYSFQDKRYTILKMIKDMVSLGNTTVFFLGNGLLSNSIHCENLLLVL